MSRYIDASKLEKHIDETVLIDIDCPIPIAVEVLKCIEDAPTADVRVNEYAHWIRSRNKRKCSKCEFVYYSNKNVFNYCPNCGAKMEKE